MDDNHRIKAVIFDLGNVLVSFDHSIAAKRIAHFCEKSPQEIFQLFFDSPVTGLFEEGKVSPYDFFLQVKEMLGLRLSYEAFVPIWNEIFFLNSANRAVYALANKLRYDYLVAVLSNINILHYEYLKKKFPVFNVFHRVFASCELGAIKPNPVVYQEALKVLSVVPEAAFYTDDRPELVESARSLGIQGFVFKGMAQLTSDLHSSGVNT